MQASCESCQKPTWKGCGRHVDQVRLRLDVTCELKHKPLSQCAQGSNTNVRVGIEGCACREAMHMQALHPSRAGQGHDTRRTVRVNMTTIC